MMTHFISFLPDFVRSFYTAILRFLSRAFRQMSWVEQMDATFVKSIFKVRHKPMVYNKN